MFVVFDLDGTLALTEHREHHLAKEPKDWDAFFAAVDADEPNQAVVVTFRALMLAGHRVEIWTGRPERVRLATQLWLLSFVGRKSGIRMRPDDDRRPDRELKGEWLAQDRPDFVFEDRDSMVTWWREQGVPCFQVAPGAF